MTAAGQRRPKLTRKDKRTDMEVYDSILDLIGNTPIVRLPKLNRGYKPNLLAKLEMFSPGNSVKDRIGVTMIKAAEEKGLLKKGGVIVEPTSGNTGTGLAIVAAILGYKCVFVMPDKVSQEKISLLKAYGADVVTTPTAVPRESPERKHLDQFPDGFAMCRMVRRQQRPATRL